MKIPASLSTATLLLLAVPLAAQRPHDQLFDGRTLAGWRGDLSFWSVEGGAIVGRSTAQHPCTANTFLVHRGEYDDFEFRCSFRIAGGNSGVQFRSKEVAENVVAGPQADLEAGPDYTGMIYEEKGRGIMVPRGEHAHFGEGGGVTRRRFADAAFLQSKIRGSDWNEYVVRAVGRSVVLAINGHVTSMLVDNDPTKRATTGFFALQLHAGPPMEVRFRDLRVTRLTADANPLPDDVVVPTLGDGTADGGGAPQWIWSSPSPREDERITMVRSFRLAQPARALRIAATCDNAMTLFLDGEQLLHDDQWETLASKAMDRHVAQGDHVLRADCANDGGPAGLALRVEFAIADGTKEVVVSDGAWRWAASASEPDWRAVHSFGPTSSPAGPWPDPFHARSATPAEKLTVALGFRVELVRSAGPDEGSWIALGFDPQGRAIVSRERASLARITLPAEPGSESSYEPLDGTPEGAMGFDWLGGALFVQASDEKGHGLFRLRDTDGDDRYDEQLCVLRLGGGGEHGAHAVVAGPDGRLWLMNGNMSPLPKSIDASSPLRFQREDVMLPLVEDPRGHAVGVRVPGGHVLRVSPDGAHVELFAGGFRNAYDMAFAPDGELFTFDSDMEWDIGLPWYRGTRVYHVPSGADFEWRSGAGCNSASYAYLPAPVADVGLSSPTGVLFGTKLAFHPAMRNALFVADWAWGRILVVHFTRQGASFTGRVESFITGKPLNVTDLVAGPDGALWFVTGGRGTQSGLYRVTWDGPVAAPFETSEWVSAPLAAQRRALEADHVGPRDGAVDRAFASLGSTDRAIAHAARVALEAQPVADWRARAMQATEARVALNALHALVRAGTDVDRAAALSRLGFVSPAALGRAQRIAWLRTHFVALSRGVEGLDDALRVALLARFDPLFPSRDFEVDRELLRLLVMLGAVELPKRAMPLLDELEVGPAIEIAYDLRLVAGDWPDRGRERFFEWLGRAKLTPGGLSFRGYVEAIERDALARAPEAERAGLTALAKPVVRPLPSLAEVKTAPRAWTLAELEGFLPLADAGRDFERGRAAFTKAVCSACHRIDGQGGDVGPDLTAVASRFSRRDILIAILEPSRDLSDQYQNVELELRDGGIVVGRIVQEDAQSLEVIVEPISRVSRTVRARDVVARKPATISPMPPSLLNLLTLEEVLDLVAYLESGGNPNLPVFGR